MREGIHRFFEVLDREFGQPARILVTGAAAAALLGSVRPSQDVDFEIELGRASPAVWEELQRAIEATVAETGIRANYAEGIDRWGAVTLMDYRRHTLAYRRFGNLEVRLLDPVYWAIGKLDRYIQSDVQDLVAVLRKRKPSWQKAVAVWGRALRRSPRSEALPLFRKQTEGFLRTYGRKVWGRRFDAASAIGLFRRHAGLQAGH